MVKRYRFDPEHVTVFLIFAAVASQRVGTSALPQGDQAGPCPPLQNQHYSPLAPPSSELHEVPGFIAKTPYLSFYCIIIQNHK